MKKTYKYGNEEFEVFQESAHSISVKGKGLTGKISWRESTGYFTITVANGSIRHDNIETALDTCCDRILRKSAAPSREEQEKSLKSILDKLD